MGSCLIQVLGRLKKQKKQSDQPSTVTWNAKIAAAAVTVVKNEENTLPFKVQTGDHVLLFELLKTSSWTRFGYTSLIADGVLPKDTSFVAKNCIKNQPLIV